MSNSVADIKDMRRYYSCTALLHFLDRYKHSRDESGFVHARTTYERTKALIKNEDLVQNLDDLESRING